MLASMARLGIPTLGWLTAVLMSLIVLSVFWTLQNYGPKSTVRRFHEAAAKLDRNAAADLVTPNFGSRVTQELWIFVASLLSSGRFDYGMVLTQREDDKAVVVVQYRADQGEPRSLIWALLRDPQGRWIIDTQNTTLAARRLLNPRNLSQVPVR